MLAQDPQFFPRATQLCGHPYPNDGLPVLYCEKRKSGGRGSGFTLQLDLYPVSDGRIVLRTPKAKEA